MSSSRVKVGIISDTHGVLRPEAFDALSGVDKILHAGDIGKPDILAKLAAIAPVTAVRGNNDGDAWAANLPETALLQLAGLTIFLIHDVNEIAVDLNAAGVQIVIAGHSHRPLTEMRNGILFINPGSAGPRRFKLPISLAYLNIADGIPEASIFRLDTA